jgi:hypothetical protein
MKNKTIAVAVIASFVSFAVWRIAKSEDANPGLAMKPDGTSEVSLSDQTISETAEARAINAMEREQRRIAERVGMSAPMEIELVNGVDPIQEIMNDGFIMEATLEEVEAALSAALKTPTLNDDKAAHRLKHRGSYRFFAPDAATSISR